MSLLTVLGHRRTFCDGLTRRELLTAGGLSTLGGFFGAPHIFGAPLSGLDSAQLESASGKAKSVILLFLHGGAATQDMYDLKPDAPAEIRGEFKPIDTNVRGIRICEHLPRTAHWMHKAAIVRTVDHRAACHNTLPAFTGHEILVTDQSNADPNHPPSMGAVCEYLSHRHFASGADARSAEFP